MDHTQASHRQRTHLGRLRTIFPGKKQKQGRAGRDSSEKRKNQQRPASSPSEKAAGPVGLVASIEKQVGALYQLQIQNNREKRVLIADAVQRGFELAEASSETWTEFIGLSFWDENPKARPKPDDQVYAVRFVVRCYQGNHRRASKRTSEIDTAVQQLRFEGLDDSDIVQALIEGRSIVRLGKLAATRKKEKSAAKTIRSLATAGPRKDPIASRSVAQATKTPARSKPGKVKFAQKPENGVEKLPLEVTFPKGLGGFLATKSGAELNLTVRFDSCDGTPKLTVLGWSEI